MRTKLSSHDIADSGAKWTGEDTPDDQLYEVPGKELSELVSQLRTLEMSLAEIRSFSQGAGARPQKLQEDYVALLEQSSAERVAFDQAKSAWCAEKETLLGSNAALEQSVADMSQANVSLTGIVAGLQREIEVLSASLLSGNSELAQKAGAIHELERRLKESVREKRNGEEYARQVMLELLRVREEQEATQRRADAAAAQAALADQQRDAAAKAALAGQQRDEMRDLLRKAESTCLDMEQTPGWWLIKSFHGRMKRSPRLATAIGLVLKAARSLRLLPAGSPWEVQWIAPLVDQEFYFRTYPEAEAWGGPAAEHYFRLGASQGYNPSSVFDTRFYLTQYPDVASTRLNPLLHYVHYGAREGRRTHADPEEAPCADSREPEVAGSTPAGSPWEVQRIAPLVDQEYYFRTYPEAEAWGGPAAEHYFRLGASQGYNPSSVFDTRFYLTQYPDVASSGLNPLLHYVLYGAAEGRRTHADPEEPAPEGIKLQERFAVRSHRELVSIIVPIHNALEHVRACLSSILRHTFPPYELVLVDDGSEPRTCEYLRRFAAQQGALLLRSDTASGYTLAANRGLRAARGEHVVLLNSDTIVTKNWLDRMVMCAESDSHIGIVGPLSNRASWQSIPEIFGEDGWAANELPGGWTPHDMARAVAASTGRIYPRIPFLNGFCLLIKRQVLEGLGYFDEVNFGRGYGEENDYCLRARAAGWVLAVSDDAYVYHAQTRSYSVKRRDELSAVADRMLGTKHKRALIDQGVKQVRDHLVLLGIRARASQMFARQSLIEEGRRRWEGKRIAFVLPAGQQCGGPNVVLAEALAMEKFGADVLIVNLLANRPAFEAGYPGLNLRVVFVPTGTDVPDAVRGYDAVIATAYHSVPLVEHCARGAGAPIAGYYIQDFEPKFFPADSAEHSAAFSSYSLSSSMVRFTKTAWNRDEVLSHTGVDCAVIGPSCDVDLFRPRLVRLNGKLNISAMIRPNSPRRAARETMEVLAQVDRRHGDRVDIHLFGVDSYNSDFLDLPRNFRWTNHGLRTREQMAALLSAQDIFVDLSHYQAMGLTALEAMASGAAVVLPQSGGASAFAVHGENALVVDTSDQAACLQAIGTLIEDTQLLTNMRRRAASDVVRFWPEQAAFNILSALFLEGKPVPPPSVSYLAAQV